MNELTARRPTEYTAVAWQFVPPRQQTRLHLAVSTAVGATIRGLAFVVAGPAPARRRLG